MQTRGPLIVALLLALVSTFFAYKFFNNKPATKSEGKLIEVVVATENIPQRTRITEQMITGKKVPASYIHKDALKSLKQAVGRVTQAEIMAGEQILGSRLVEKGKEPSLSFAIPPGMRAITVAANEVIGVAGFILPGDRVDVLATFPGEKAGEETTTVVLESVEVLAISQDREEGEKKAKVATTVTLAVNAQEAAKLTLAEEMGKLRLALRPAVGGEAREAAKATAGELVGRPASQPRKISKPTGAPSKPPSKAKPKVSKPKQIEIIEGGRRSFVTVD